MEQVSALYDRLQELTQEGRDDESLETCNQLLNIDVNDQLALRCKVVTLIRLGNYTDALSLIARRFKNSEIDLSYEKIYCYYRTNQFQPALELIQELKAKQNTGDVYRLKTLEAQVLYAQGKYERAIHLYRDLLDATDANSPQYFEIYTNLLAAKAGATFLGESVEKLDNEKSKVHESDLYETLYNEATLSLARSDLDGARRQLEAARKLCHDKLTDADTPKEEMDEELAVIATQLAYAYQLQGYVEDAKEIYQSVIDLGIKDPVVRSVVSNNMVAFQQKKDLFDATKKLKIASSKESEARLQRYQKRVIATNEGLLQLYLNKHSSCKDACHKLLKEYPEDDQIYLIMAASTYQQQKAEAAVEELKKYAETNPASLALCFATIQLQLLQSQSASALSTLEAYLSSIGKEQKDRYHRPALIALLVWLYEQTGQSEKAMGILDEASTYWKTDKSFASGAPKSTIYQTAAFKLKTGRFQEAVADYEELVRSDPTDQQAIAGLILAYSEIDPQKAEQYANALPTIAISQADTSSLEQSVPGVKRRYVKKTDKREHVPRPKTKKRKPLLPKNNYDPDKTPDPERWLPKRERSTYRPKGKKKLASGPQGTYVPGGGIGSTGSARIDSNDKPTAITTPTSNKQSSKSKKKKGRK